MQMSADGGHLRNTLRQIRAELEKQDALTGHNVRRGLWESWKRSEGSNVGYYISTTIYPFVWAGAWTFLLFLIYQFI